MMLKKTLHTAVAAIAVSTICLPTAEAKEPLILDPEGAKWYTVSTQSMVYGPSGELEPYSHHSGTVNFNGKVLETHWSSRLVGEPLSGDHVLCGQDSPHYWPWESSQLFRGSNPDNTLTMDTVSAEDSAKLDNLSASVVCFDNDWRATSAHWTYQISDATGKWSCAYGETSEGYYGELFYTEESTGTVQRPFRPQVSFDPVESNSHGPVIIPRPCEQ